MLDQNAHSSNCLTGSRWMKTRLGELGQLIKGRGITRSEIRDEGLPCLRYGEIYSTYKTVTARLSSRISQESANQACALRSGDIVFAASGETPEEIGKAITYIGDEQAFVGGDTVVLRNHEQDPVFLAHFLNSDPIVREKSRLGKGQSVVHIHTPDLASIEVSLPPLVEQRKVAEILRTWDEALEKLAALRAAKELQYRAFARKFFESCHPSFHGRPNNWREFELGDIFTERSEAGADGERLLSITMTGGVIDRDDVGRKDTSTEDKSRYKLVLPGDLAYNTMRMWQGVSGLSTMRGIVSPAYTVVTPKERRLLGRYAAHLFKSRRMVFDFERYSQGLTSDTWNLKFPAFSKIKVRLPPVDDQEKRADLLDSMLCEQGVLRRQIEALTRQKRGLMQKLLTGQWRVKFASPSTNSKKGG